MDERAARPQRLVWRALVLPLLTQGPGLLPMISDPGLTLVFRGRHNGQLTLSPYPCPIICNCDRWQPGRAACEKGQRQWKDQDREKGAASGFQIQVTSEFWISKMDKPFFGLLTQTELSLQPTMQALGTWVFWPVCGSLCARLGRQVC